MVLSESLPTCPKHSCFGNYRNLPRYMIHATHAENYIYDSWKHICIYIYTCIKIFTYKYEIVYYIIRDSTSYISSGNDSKLNPGYLSLTIRNDWFGSGDSELLCDFGCVCQNFQGCIHVYIHAACRSCNVYKHAVGILVHNSWIWMLVWS